MKRLLREPVELEYDEDGKLCIVWTYTIVETINGKHKHYAVTVNKKFITITGIRQAVFLCKTDKDRFFNVTTREPPEHIEYKLEKPHSNKQHTKITLPRGFVKVSKGDKIKIRYYPREEDIYGTGGPRITFDVYTPFREPQSSARVVPMPEGAAMLVWEVVDGVIPDDLEPFLTQNDKDRIKEDKNPLYVSINSYTMDVSFEPMPEVEA